MLCHICINGCLLRRGFQSAFAILPRPPCHQPIPGAPTHPPTPCPLPFTPLVSIDWTAIKRDFLLISSNQKKPADLLSFLVFP